MDTLDGRGLSRVVAKADLLKLAARAQNDLLAEFLGDSPEDSPENTPDAAPLYAAGLLPQELGQLWPPPSRRGTSPPRISRRHAQHC
jgi:hypothetical protein